MKKRPHPCLRLAIESLDPRLMLSATALQRTTWQDVQVAGYAPQDGPGGLVAAAERFLSDQHEPLGLPADITQQLRLVESKFGLASGHVRFQQMHAGLPVHDARLSVHMNLEGVVQTVHSSYRAVTEWAGDVAAVEWDAAVEAAEQQAVVSAVRLAPRGEAVWLVDKDGTARPGWELTVFADQPLGDFLTVVDAEGDVVRQENRLALATGTGKVFQPNPYQTQGHGTGLVDSNDANNATLTAQRVTVTLQGLDEGTGLLRGEFVNLSSLNSPNLGDVDANEPSRIYDYTRDDPRFEQVVVYHAVDSVQRYIHSLGFDDDSGLPNGIRDFPTLANAHWYTDDNSFYSTGDDAIHFGDGGVDDAEDADIVLHEYGHAVQHDQNNFWGGGEMGAMGEGFGDYLAATFYAETGNATFLASHAAAVGEWDAVSYSSDNPPNLRRVDGNKIYPINLVGQVHADGEIWSAALWDLRAALGKETTDRLVLEHHFALPAGALMPDAAQAILQADVNLNGGVNEAAITQVFEDRGILGGSGGTDDHGNNATTTSWAQADSSIVASLESYGDSDWFGFHVLAGTRIRFDTALLGLSDSYLELIGTNGVTTIASDDDSGPGLASSLTWTAPSTGKYWIKVRAYSPSQLGQYRLTTTLLTDDYGETPGAAAAIVTGGAMAGTVEMTDDSDMFSFSAAAGQSYELSVVPGGLTETRLELYGTDGTTSLAVDDDGGAALMAWQAPSSGTYYARVGGLDHLAGSYTLQLVESTTAPGDFNGDGDYDCHDINALTAAVAAGTHATGFDLDGDSLVDGSDLLLWLQLAGAANLASGNAYLVGDANLDGVVDVSDFNQWNAHKFAANAAWCDGDFNADGVIDVSDYNLWNETKFRSAVTLQGLTSPVVLPAAAAAAAPGAVKPLTNLEPSNGGSAGWAQRLAGSLPSRGRQALSDRQPIPVARSGEAASEERGHEHFARRQAILEQLFAVWES